MKLMKTLQNHTVLYDAECPMCKAYTNAFPIFRPLFNCKPFITAMRKVYAFISYNRKVIIHPAQR